ncbi:hypothetical protein GVN18_20765 [Pseudomonas sp. ODNR1LW]|nr:hypothetical protein [Pseudomonas sp. ODNR1LW]
MNHVMRSAAVGIFCSTLAIGAIAQEYTLSEQLLAGENHLESAKDYPDTLTLPTAWTDGFKKMYAITKKTSQEVSSCLLMYETEESSKARDDLYVEYESLIRKRKTLPPDEFAVQRAALRKMIDEGAITEWGIGNIQKGEEWTVEYDFATGDCRGSYLGQVHTHPIQSYAVHSERDLMISIEENNPLSIVVNKDHVCVFIRDNTNAGTSKLQRGQTTSNYLSSPSPSNIVVSLEHVAAGIVGSHGAAYFCGTIGQPLKKIAPAVQQENNPRVILGAKALVVMGQNANPALRYSLDFPFTPVLDGEFLASAAKILGVPVSTVKAWSGKKLFEKLSVVVTGVNEVAFSNGVTLPDTRFKKATGPVRAFTCKLQKSVDCEVDRFTSGENGVIEASYEPDGSYRVAELQPGGAGLYRLTEVDGKTGQSLSGQANLIGADLTMSGPAHLKGDGYEMKGTFEGWKPVGDVKFRRGDETAWRPGRFENGHLTQTGVAQ